MQTDQETITTGTRSLRMAFYPVHLLEADTSLSCQFLPLLVVINSLKWKEKQLHIITKISLLKHNHGKDKEKMKPN